jgi:hypothetical protein
VLHFNKISMPACWCVLDFLHFSFSYLKLVNGNKITVHLNYLIAIYATSGLLILAGGCLLFYAGLWLCALLC